MNDHHATTNVSPTPDDLSKASTAYLIENVERFGVSGLLHELKASVCPTCGISATGNTAPPNPQDGVS